MQELAQINIARLVAPKDDPSVADFMSNLDRINGLGKRADGFVWIMEGEPGRGNTEVYLNGDPRMITNLTVWRDVQSLWNFAHLTLHKQFMARRAEWFEPPKGPSFVMWWVPKGHRPTLAEAMTRLDLLTQNGASEEAFDWAYARATYGLTGDRTEEMR